MLARLEELDGVELAETDFAGDLLRLSLRDDRALTEAADALVALGYGAEPSTDAAADVRWYDARSVGELSRVEANVIAERVTTRFIETHDGAIGDAGRLRAAIADALHGCFVTVMFAAGPSSGGFRAECVARTMAAVGPIVGHRADELGRLLDDDMRQEHGERS